MTPTAARSHALKLMIEAMRKAALLAPALIRQSPASLYSKP